MAPQSSRSRPGGGGGVLPPLTLDAVYEVLLRLAARELCRLHAVSRPWRALLSDPQFVSAHAARHPGPLVVACYGPSSGYPEGDILCEIMDLSGRVVKRIRAMGDGIRKDWVVSAQLDFVQIVREMSSYRLLDPATGAIFALPEELADEDTALQLDMYKYRVGLRSARLPRLARCFMSLLIPLLSLLPLSSYSKSSPLMAAAMLDEGQTSIAQQSSMELSISSSMRITGTTVLR